MNKYKKIIVIGVVVVLLSGLALFDYIRAQGTKLEVVSISPEIVVADPNKPVMITLRASKRGSIAVGDDITALVKGDGNLSGDKVRVNKDGTVTFKYYPYSYIEGVFGEKKVEIEFRNISDSVFIAIQKPFAVTLDVKKPSDSGSGMNMGDIFGEE